MAYQNNNPAQSSDHIDSSQIAAQSDSSPTGIVDPTASADQTSDMVAGALATLLSYETAVTTGIATYETAPSGNPVTVSDQTAQSSALDVSSMTTGDEVATAAGPSAYVLPDGQTSIPQGYSLVVVGQTYALATTGSAIVVAGTTYSVASHDRIVVSGVPNALPTQPTKAGTTDFLSVRRSADFATTSTGMTFPNSSTGKLSGKANSTRSSTAKGTDRAAQPPLISFLMVLLLASILLSQGSAISERGHVLR